MKKFCSLFVFAVLALGSLVFNSCTEVGDDILSTIPQRTAFVTKVNADKILASADVRLSDGNYKLSAALNELSYNLTGTDRKLLDEFLEAIPAIDSENIYIYSTVDEDVILTCGVKHKSELTKALTKQFGSSESIDGFTVYDINGDALLLRDNQLWMSDKAEYIIKAVKSAAEQSVADKPGFREQLAADNAVTAIIDDRIMTNIVNKQGIPARVTALTDNTVIYLNFENEKLILGYDGFNDDGTRLKMQFDDKYVIEKEALDYVPENSIAACAIGWLKGDTLKAMIKNAGISDAEIDKVVNGINGSSTLSVQAPERADYLLLPRYWNMTMSIGMNRESADYIMDIAAQVFRVNEVNGIKMVDINNYDILGGGTFSYKYFDNGYMVISTDYKNVKENHSSLVDGMAGQPVALHACLAKNDRIATDFEMPFGIDINTNTGEHGYTITVSLLDSKRPFIDAILNLAVDRRWQQNAFEVISAMNYNRNR